MNKSEQINELSTALAKAQGEIRGAVKDDANPHFKMKYASLASVWDACRKPLCDNGLSVIQTTDINPQGEVVLLTTLFHSSGQYLGGTYPLRPIKDDPQGMGSALTYARRYTLASLVGVAPEDDDGEGSTGRGDAPEGKQTQRPAPKAAAKPPKPAEGALPAQNGTPVTREQAALKWAERSAKFSAHYAFEDEGPAQVAAVEAEIGQGQPLDQWTAAQFTAATTKLVAIAREWEEARHQPASKAAG